MMMNEEDAAKIGYILRYLKMWSVHEDEKYYIDWMPEEFRKCKMYDENDYSETPEDCWGDWVQDAIIDLCEKKKLPKLPWE